MPRTMAALTAALLTLLTVAGCAATAPARGGGDGPLRVVTAFYPLEYLARRIGGPAVTVTELTKPGAEPHDIELNPRQVGDIVDAGLVVYLKGFQPAVDQAVEQEAADRAFDVGTVVDLLPLDAHDPHLPGDEHAEAYGGLDPHVWLDPVRYAQIAAHLGERLAHADPAHATDYTARAAALGTDLDRLHADYAGRLQTCARREIVTSHTAFNYLARRYRLTEIGITGVTPEAEPAPRRLAEVAQQARDTGATTIFFETLVSPKVAQTIADEIGARTAVLDPLEGQPAGDGDYFTVMRANLASLTQALGCTR
ncbi:metal ABC transporter substrate-binding protein [Mangrovihabitans endophyticus]|uniref:Zinc ABC transporter substrate-binding protein n=1 Tax=Mangrovihabitans endophyticus TaxID=1751298 RepID=A0A8J3C4H5_9ACTN|nr:metal ABC transporter substrate-binding protein [Mangrovihabitans endophyticus]GGL17566.1 zinc ABC transporter substrate-binding protein [Mangrovihabitans endophyticus]